MKLTEGFQSGTILEEFALETDLFPKKMSMFICVSGLCQILAKKFKTHIVRRLKRYNVRGALGKISWTLVSFNLSAFSYDFGIEDMTAAIYVTCWTPIGI